MTQRRRNARQRKLNPLQMILILAAVGFAGWYAYANLAPKPSPYATISAGSLGAHYSGEVLIVRNETPYTAEGVTRVEYIADEGKVAYRGTEICNVYSSGYSSRDLNNLQDYRDQIRDYERKLLDANTTYDAKMQRVESDVLTRAREVREIIGGMQGNLSNQATLLEAAIDARQKYIRTQYATDQRLSRLLEDELNQNKTIAAQKRQHAAIKDTMVSFYSDGYEFGLTMENYATFTPAQVRAMIQGRKPDGANPKNKITIYRTIEDGSYVVLFLVNDTSWNPVVGQSYELQLERFENTLVTGWVESCTRSGGELLVRLRVNDQVEPVLYMRACQATLRDYMQTLCVPAKAIHNQDGMVGVVVVTAGNMAFVPVQVIYDAGSNVYVAPVTQGLLYEGQTVMLF